MLAESMLKDILHQEELSKTDKLLVCLATDVDNPKSVRQIKEIAQKGGLKIDKWNTSSLLSRSKGLAIRTPKGWELTSKGRIYLSTIEENSIGSPIPSIASQLRNHLSKIAHSDTCAFVEEAIQCVEHHFYRAAVVLSWVGAVSVLYEHIVANHLTAFNNETLRRDAKWKQAKTCDDLAKLKEADFLDILETISVLGKSVKLELKKCLDLRNGCGHPNSLHIGENIVAAHIETLILNVFSQFSI